MNDLFLKPYDPGTTEERIYSVWLESGFFNPDVCIEKGVTKPDAPHFSVVLPPPNVTGTLHMGHAFEDTVQDIVVRFERMRGKRTLWIPGTDHAAIATESKVAKIIEKEEGKRKHDFSREEFLGRVEKFAQESHDTIVKQVKRMGASLDWSREAFTLDTQRNLAVRTVFKKMFDDGIIYRGYRVINWDPKGQTTISDDEIVHEERKAVMYTFKYSHDFPIAISTTRPETKVGDTAVAVHPDDPRYTQYIGQTFSLDFLGEKLEIKIVADKEVDPAFGTGALGVTPAHSIIDWEIAKRHDLAVKPVIDEFAKMTVASPLLSGKKVAEAREIVVSWLQENGLMIESQEISQNISTAERTGGIIEPLPKLQWFVNVTKEFPYPHADLPNVKKGELVTLKKLMLSVVQNKDIEMLPDRFEKVYMHWIENLHDWCISRQIWYGHRIPVWYRLKNGKLDGGSLGTRAFEDGSVEIYCGVNPPSGNIYSRTDYFDDQGWTQDSDTLDTWFSSGMWTFSTLGWPGKSTDMERFHPTSFMGPGYEILPFWVARMILMSTYVLGQIPFKTVYLHGIVRDAKGQKFSKSSGNNLDPLEIINQFGCDALRMALTVGIGPGNDSKFDMAKVKAYKLFANKIWNITRYVLTSIESWDKQKPAQITEADQVLLTELDALVADITADMDAYRFYLAGEKLYHYVWHTFADKIIEESKEKLKSSDPAVAASIQYTLHYILITCLKLLHPFMPFITEEIWSHIPHPEDKNLLMVTQWPK